MSTFADSDFPSTRWTLIHKVQTGSEQESTQALNQLCRTYWYPIYAYARRYGFKAEDAEDITQVFFQNLVTYECLQAVAEEKGKLRSFMLAMLKRIVSKHLRRDAAEKRGGSKATTLSFEELDAEARYATEPADTHDPDTLFDRAWARDVLATAEARLREDYARADNTHTFEQLREFLQIHRMRKRYAKIIEAVIAETVSDPAEQKAELEHLLRVVGG